MLGVRMRRWLIVLGLVASGCASSGYGKVVARYDEYEQKTLYTLTTRMDPGRILILGAWGPRGGDQLTMRFVVKNPLSTWAGCERVNFWADGEAFKPSAVTHSAGERVAVVNSRALDGANLEVVTFEMPTSYLRTIIRAAEAKVLICGRDEYWITTENARDFLTFHDEVLQAPQ